MTNIAVGQKYILTEALSHDILQGTIATVLFIDDIGQVFVEWDNGKQSSFSTEDFQKKFEQFGFDF